MTIEYKDSKRIVGLSLTTSDNFSSTSGWTQLDSAKIGIDTSNERLDFDIEIQTIDNAYRSIPTGGSTWVMRYKLRFTTLTATSGSGIYFVTDISNDGTTAGNNWATGAMGIQLNFDESNNKALALYGDGAAAVEIFVPVINTDYYVEVLKTGSTTVTATIGTDSYGGVANGGTASMTGVTASTAQDTFAVRNRGTASGSSGHTVVGYIKDFQFTNNTNTAGDVKPTNVQDNSILVEKDTAKRYWRTPALAPTVSDDLTTDKGWISTVTGNGYNATHDRVDFKISCPPDTSSFAGGRFLIDLQDSDYLDGSNLATNFIIRFPWKLTDSTLVSSGSETRSYLGLFSSDAWGGTSQDYFGIQLFVSSTTRYALRVECIDGGTFQGGTETRTDTTLIPVVDTQYYFELKKVGDVHSFTVTTNSDYTGGQTVNVTKTGITGLRYFGIKSRGDSQTANGNIEGYVSPDIEVYNGVTSVTPATWTRQPPSFTASFWTAGGTPSPWSAGTFHDEFNGSTWSTATALGTGVFLVAGCGSKTAGLIMGGDRGGTNTPSSTVQAWNGSAWSTSTGGTLNIVRNQNAGGGISTGAWVQGGTTGSMGQVNTSSFWNNSSWTAGALASSDRRNHGGAGSTTDCWITGGYNGTADTASTENYNGTAWSAGGNLSTATNANMGGGGDSYNAFITGGSESGGNSNKMNIYNGIAWSQGGVLSRTHKYGSSGGTPQNAWSGAGYTGGAWTNGTWAELYNGTAWSTTGSLSSSRATGAGGN